MEQYGLADVQALDRCDPLAPMRDAFVLPAGKIYLDGNSLGPLPKATLVQQERMLRQEWGQGLIGSWNDAGWIDASARIGASIAKLIGADADEVIAADSTSVNLFKLMVAGLRARPGRSVLLTETGNFPTDLHVAEGAAACVAGCTVRAVSTADLLSALTSEVALVVLTHVHYRSGARHDMAAFTRAAHEAGALVLWDLSHSTGAVPVDLNAFRADLAVGCGYKFLNGGPGAPAFLFVARRWQETMRSPLQGWFGHAAPFAFSDVYEPAPGVARFLCGTPPMLSLGALESGIALWRDIELPLLYKKSQALFALFQARTRSLGELTLLTPADPAKRGSQIAFSHAHAYAIMQALIGRGVIGDFRAPDVLRFGLTPLYTRFEDVWHATEILADIIVRGSWADYSNTPAGKVT